MDDHRSVRFPSFPAIAALPAVDVFETRTTVVVVAEIPGADPSSLRVVKEGQILLIAGERREPPSDSKIRLFHMEIDYGRFEREIVLPEALGTEGARAVFEYGLLRVELPKRGPSGTRSRIPIDRV